VEETKGATGVSSAAKETCAMVTAKQGGNEIWGFNGNVIQTYTGTAKQKGNDETNAMVCSPPAKDERRRWKISPELERSSPELGKMTEATSDSRD
jgi:uncharacterized protein (UPF0333 family)